MLFIFNSLPFTSLQTIKILTKIFFSRHHSSLVQSKNLKRQWTIFRKKKKKKKF